MHSFRPWTWSRLCEKSNFTAAFLPKHVKTSATFKALYQFLMEALHNFTTIWLAKYACCNIPTGNFLSKKGNKQTNATAQRKNYHMNERYPRP